MSTVAHLRPNLDYLLRQFFAGDTKARNTFPRETHRYLMKIARQLSKGMPEDMLGEVVNQTLENLLKLRADAYDPRRGGAGTFLGLIVRDAVRQVRANYTPPGETTRMRKRALEKESIGFGTNLMDCGNCGRKNTMVGQDAGQIEIDAEVADPNDTVWLLEVRHDLTNALNMAPESVAESLTRMHVYGEAFGDVAADLGVSRFSLKRQIDRYVREMRSVGLR